jgi:hypothetical protein
MSHHLNLISFQSREEKKKNKISLICALVKLLLYHIDFFLNFFFGGAKQQRFIRKRKQEKAENSVWVGLKESSPSPLSSFFSSIGKYGFQ